MSTPVRRPTQTVDPSRLAEADRDRIDRADSSGGVDADAAIGDPLERRPVTSTRTSFLENPRTTVRMFAVIQVFGFAAGLVYYQLLSDWDDSTGVQLIYMVTQLTLATAVAVRLLWSVGRREAVTLAVLLQVGGVVASQQPIGPIAPAAMESAPMGLVPWACVLLAVFPLIVPSRASFHALIAFGCASLEPIEYLVRVSAGFAYQPMEYVANDTFALYLCATVATLASHLLAKARSDLAQAKRRAREMGSYRLMSLLGEGGMGEVWLARHRLLARPAAIKLIRPATQELSPDQVERILERFEREARVTARLRSMHTVELYDFGRTATGEFYYAMEFLDGVDLAQLVRDSGPPPLRRTVSILEQVCSSLSEAHSYGLVHRDVKPANIFVCRSGMDLDVVKVLDFGLVSDVTVAHGEREERSIQGTPAFMAPEAIESPEAIDARLDLYAVGCVAYWLLTGSLVFEEESTKSMILAHLEKDPDPPSLHSPHRIPPELDAIVLRCLAKDPEDRPASAVEIRSALDWIAVPDDWTREDQERYWRERPMPVGSWSPI